MSTKSGILVLVGTYNPSNPPIIVEYFRQCFYSVYRGTVLRTLPPISPSFSPALLLNTTLALPHLLNLICLLFVLLWVKGVSVSWVLLFGGHYQCMSEEPWISKIFQFFVINISLIEHLCTFIFLFIACACTNVNSIVILNF